MCGRCRQSLQAVPGKLPPLLLDHFNLHTSLKLSFCWRSSLPELPFPFWFPLGQPGKRGLGSVWSSTCRSTTSDGIRGQISNTVTFRRRKPGGTRADLAERLHRISDGEHATTEDQAVAALPGLLGDISKHVHGIWKHKRGMAGHSWALWLEYCL